MTQTQSITNRVYDKHMLTITPLEVVLMAELSDQIPIYPDRPSGVLPVSLERYVAYPHTDALGEDPNTSKRMDWDKMASDIMTWLGLNALAAGVVVCAGWLLFEAFHAIAQMVTALFGLL